MIGNLRSDQARRGGEKAFTLIELLIVIAILGVLLGLVLPALSQAQARGRAVSCLNNLRQVLLACHLYVGDHEDRFPHNYGGADTVRTIASKKYLNWMNNIMTWELESWNTNEALVLAGGLGPYAGGGVRLFKCPSDQVLSTLQRGEGWEARTRSFSMNAMLGDAGEFTRTGKNVNNPHYKQFFHLSAVHEPSRIFAFIEEHPDSINDGYFLNKPETGEWIDLPASYHRGGANLAFVDGHTEYQQWRDASTQPPARPDAARLPFAAPRGLISDYDWLMNRTSAKRY